jgi:tetratricopeptide (TPR) repeat protein
MMPNMIADEPRKLDDTIADSARLQGKYRRAIELYEQAKTTARQLAEPRRMTYLEYRIGLVYFHAQEFSKSAACWNEAGRIMDEEYRLNLELLSRWTLRWASGMGLQTDKHVAARYMSHILCRLYRIWERAMTPSNWLRRQLWRLTLWAARF